MPGHHRTVPCRRKKLLSSRGAGKGHRGEGIALAFAKSGGRRGTRRPNQRRPLKAVADEHPGDGPQTPLRFPPTSPRSRGYQDVHRSSLSAPWAELDIVVNNAGPAFEQLGTYADMTVAILESAFRFQCVRPV